MTGHRVLADIAQLDAGSAGIFAFADPFDAVLRALSSSYVEAAWNKLQPVLERMRIDRATLRLGYTHPGYTTIAWPSHGPLAYCGWISRDAWVPDGNVERFIEGSAELASPSPALQWGAADVRVQQFDVDPDDFALAVRILSALAIDEVSDWLTADHVDTVALDREPWRAVVRAWRTQSGLDEEMRHAERNYSAAGFRIVVDAVTRMDAVAVRP